MKRYSGESDSEYKGIVRNSLHNHMIKHGCSYILFVSTYDKQHSEANDWFAEIVQIKVTVTKLLQSRRHHHHHQHMNHII